MDATRRSGTAYPSGAPKFTLCFCVAYSLVFYVVFCRSLFVLFSIIFSLLIYSYMIYLTVNIYPKTFLTLFFVMSMFVLSSQIVITIRCFPHSLLTTVFVTGVTRRVPHMEQELLTFTDALECTLGFWWGSWCSSG